MDEPVGQTRRSPRSREIVAAARHILETDGRDALTMRRLGEAVGMRAPSLYKHFPDKASVESELISDGFDEITERSVAALSASGESLSTLANAYRRFARAHPALYRLMTSGPLPRERLRPGVETRAGAPLIRVTGSPNIGRAAWAFAHGMLILELDGRFPEGADLDAAWAAGIAAFNHEIAATTTRDEADGLTPDAAE